MRISIPCVALGIYTIIHISKNEQINKKKKQSATKPTWNFNKSISTMLKKLVSFLWICTYIFVGYICIDIWKQGTYEQFSIKTEIIATKWILSVYWSVVDIVLNIKFLI